MNKQLKNLNRKNKKKMIINKKSQINFTLKQLQQKKNRFRCNNNKNN